MISLSPRHVKIAKIVGYPLFFLLLFTIFLSLTFPSSRFVPQLENRLSNILGREVIIGNLKVSPLGSMSLKGVRIIMPDVSDNSSYGDNSDEGDEDEDEEDDDDKDNDRAQKEVVSLKREYYVERIKVKVSLFKLLFGDLKLKAEMDFLGGELALKLQMPLSKKEVDDPQAMQEAQAISSADSEDEEKAGLAVFLSVKNLNMVQFHDLAAMLPLPMFGVLSFNVDLNSSTGKLADATGEIYVEGSNISFGQGQSQVEVIDGMGPMTIEAIALASLVLDMQVENGVTSFRRVSLESPDVDAHVEGDIHLGDPFSRSRVNLYFTFRFLEGYANKSSYADTLVSLMPTALSNAHRSDGFFGYLYSGQMKNARFLPRKVFSPARGGDRGARRGGRQSSLLRTRQPATPSTPSPRSTSRPSPPPSSLSPPSPPPSASMPSLSPPSPPPPLPPPPSPDSVISSAPPSPPPDDGDDDTPDIVEKEEYMRRAQDEAQEQAEQNYEDPDDGDLE